MTDLSVIDLFSSAAGGWSLGMHRAGFHTVAACEVIPWRRALYAENNPDVRLYDDVRTLTADRLLQDLGSLPRILVGSPPCQDISSANTKGKGVDGQRSGLFFEAVRLVGEIGVDWFALENSANLRTRGADRVIAALAVRGYTCWPFVVGVDNLGGNNERKRSWLVGCNVAQITNAHHQSSRRPEQPRPEGQGRHLSGLGAAAGDSRRKDGAGPLSGGHGGLGAPADTHGFGRNEGWRRGRFGLDLSVQENLGDAAENGCGSRLQGRPAGATPEPEQPPRRHDVHPASLGHEGRGPWGHGADGDGSSPAPNGHAPDAYEAGHALGQGQSGDVGSPAIQAAQRDLSAGRGNGGGDCSGGAVSQVGLRPADRGLADGLRADWSLDDLARHVRLDVELPAWLAGTRVAVGGPRGTSAASLIVEAYGDSVCPQIPEAIGRAILRTEAALAALYGRAA